MTITVENTISLSPEQPLGTQAVVVDGLGSVFVVWKDGSDIRVQRYDRSYNILSAWFTSFSVTPDATSDNICLVPFVSGGCAIAYFETPFIGNRIRLEYIDRNGVHVPSQSFSFAANFDPAFPQMAAATNAIDQIAVCIVNTTDQVIANVVSNLSSGAVSLDGSFAINTSLVAPQLVAGEKSLFSVTSNWTGGRFAALYLRKSDGNGLLRKFSASSTVGAELNLLEAFRECPAGGANRGNAFMNMSDSSEELLVVNPIVPIGSGTPPTQIRSRVYNTTLTGTVYSTFHANPSSATFQLNCMGGKLFANGQSVFAIDDFQTNINIFYLDETGAIIDTETNADLTTTYTTGPASLPSAFAEGNRSVVAFYNPSGPGTSFLVSMKLNEEIHVRGFASEAIELVRTLGVDDDAVDDLTSGNTTAVDPEPRPDFDLNAFIGLNDIALIGGPINNPTTAQLFSSTGQLAEDLEATLASYGITQLIFDNLDGLGNLFDDRDGTTTNAPQIRITIPAGSFVIARHKVATTVYDYAVILKLGATKNCYIFAGIRDISTKAASFRITNHDPEFDNTLENFDAVLAIVTYPDTVTTVAEFETELGLGNADIRFRPIVGIRENSPLN